VKLRGWPIVVAVTVVLMGWALTLRYLTPHRVVAPSAEDLQVRRYRIEAILARLPVNVQERFLQRIGLRTRRLDGYGYLPWKGLDVVVATGEPRHPGNAREFWARNLAQVSRTGARLVWIPTTGRAVDIPELGLQFAAGDEVVEGVVPAHPVPLLQHVEKLDLPNAGPLVRVERPVVRLLEGPRGGVYGVLVPVGQGEVVVINAPGIDELDGIEWADNALLLASLARRGPHSTSEVGILRARETARQEFVAALERLELEQRQEAVEEPLLTLWSMVKANPSCLVLLQLLLVALVHLLGAGRLLPAPAGLPETACEAAFERGLVGHYLRASQGRKVLLSVSAQLVRHRLERRLGLAPTGDPEALRASLQARAPEVAARLDMVSRQLETALTRKRVLTPAEFTTLVEKLSSLVEEVEA
jgi:hypothetical protein